MKRSDAIKLIGKVLVFGAQGMDNDRQKEYENKSLADIILTELEKNGVCPPKIREQVVPKTEPTFPYSQWVNKWEPEENE